MLALLALTLLQTPAQLVATTQHGPSPVAIVDTAPTVRALTAPVARVIFDFGTGAEAPVEVRALEMAAGAAPGPIQNRLIATTHVRFVRAPGALTSELTRRVASGERIASITVELAPDSGAPMVVARFYDVLVTGDRVVMHGDPGDLEQQRLALVEATAQLENDLAEARRQLTLAESLDKRKLSSTSEVARARERADLLERRRDVQRARLDLIEREIGRWMPLEEEVSLTATRSEVVAGSGR